MDIVDECHICLEELVGELCVLSCGHHFHYQCVKDWMDKNKDYQKPCCICENITEINNIYYSMNGPNEDMKIESEINNQITGVLIDYYKINSENENYSNQNTNINNSNLNNGNVNNRNINNRNTTNNQISVVEEEFRIGCCNIL